MAKFSTRDIVVTVTSKKDTKVFKDLHFNIEVIKTLSATPNIANITIFGLAKESRDFLTSIYEDEKSEFSVNTTLDDKSFFNGDIVNVRHNYNVGNWETTIYANDGYNAFRKSAKVETKKGDSRGSALDKLFDSLTDVGLNDFDIQALKNNCGNKSILKRVLYEGNVIENIKKLIKDCLPDADTFIDNKKLNILPKGSAIPKNTILTDFLAPPQLNEQGCRASVRINTDVQIGGTIELQAKSYNQAFGNLTLNRANKRRFSGEGAYKVIEIAHTFDNNTAAVAKTDITGIFLR
jgi:hypothetical protein